MTRIPLVLALFIGAFTLQAQDPPPAKPTEARQGGEEILYEKFRLEKDGMVTIYYRVGHERGRMIRAILEGIPLQIPGRPSPDVSVTPNAKSRLLTEKGWVMEAEAMHLLIVTDTKENLPYLESVLKVLDVPDPQVMIEGRVVELRWDRDLQIGLEGEGSTSTIWTAKSGTEAFLREIRTRFSPTEALTGGPFQGSTFRFGRTSAHQGNIGGIVEAFVQKGKGEILSNPRIMVQSGSEALVSAGEEIPISQSTISGGIVTTSVIYKPTGVTLKVRPHIVGSSNVQMDIDTQVTALSGFITLPSGTAPTLTNRNTRTSVTVRDGEEIVIGGLLQKEKANLRRGIPFLSDIPVIGVIFGRYEEKETVREILFFLKPVIVQSDVSRPLIDPGMKRK